MRIITDVIVKSFKKCYTFNAVDDTDSGMWWNGSEEDRNVRIVRKMTAPTVQMVIATLTGRGR